MKQLVSTRLLALGIALGALAAATVLATTSEAKASRLRAPSGTLVNLRKTALGAVLVDARGRTLYLFEKDRNGLSMCSSACAAYWPPLTSHVAPRAGSGVHKALLTLGKVHQGVRQVLYAGHPLYTFVGDKRAGQAAGEGLNNFGAEWYVVAASGQKVEANGGTSGAGSSYSGGY